MDIGLGAFSTRKLSLRVQLPPEGGYDGGELEFLVGSDVVQRTLTTFPFFLASGCGR